MECANRITRRSSCVTSRDAFPATLYENARVSHRSTGLYKALELPGVYRRFQALLGGPAALERFVSEFVRPFEGMRVLDAGCGAGSLLEYLPATVRYVGFDANPSCIGAATRRYGQRGRFFCARVGEEPARFEEEAFDLVVAVGLLHHLADADADQLLGMAAWVLAPGGAFVSLDGTLHHGQSWASALLARLDRGSEVRSPEAYRRLVEPHFPRVEDWLVTDMLAVPYSYCIMRASRLD